MGKLGWTESGNFTDGENTEEVQMEGVRTLTEPLDRETTETIGWREYGNCFNIVHLYETNVDDTMANRTFLV